MMWGTMLVTPHISAAWQHAFDGVTPDAALAFASNGIGFTVYGVPLAEDTALLDADLDLAVGEQTTVGVSYTGQFGDKPGCPFWLICSAFTEISSALISSSRRRPVALSRM